MTKIKAIEGGQKDILNYEYQHKKITLVKMNYVSKILLKESIQEDCILVSPVKVDKD